MTIFLETFYDHSFAPALLTDRPVLDVGARGFSFAYHFAVRGHEVIALDPDPDIADPKIKGVKFINSALIGNGPSTAILAKTSDPEGRYIEDGSVVVESGASRVPVHAYTIQGLSEALGIPKWDLVKLNCEGAEYGILRAWPGPIARQIVVSFHEHYRPQGQRAIDGIVEHLAQWYAPIRHESDRRFGAGLNYWDSVFALKELI